MKMENHNFLGCNYYTTVFTLTLKDFKPILYRLFVAFFLIRANLSFYHLLQNAGGKTNKAHSEIGIIKHAQLLLNTNIMTERVPDQGS